MMMFIRVFAVNGKYPRYFILETKLNILYIIKMSFSLNFVWISAVREPSLKPEDVLSCPIPDLYQSNVARIAQSMPSLPITVWLDVAGVGNNSVEIVIRIYMPSL